MNREFQGDINKIGRIAIVPQLLDVVCRITQMGFAAVARVTDENWIACAVKDDIGFGLEPGGELALETTICNEIRDSGQQVVINHVAENPIFKNHHTPLMYGFQSYISVPIVRKNGSFFGTLCAIDPSPRNLETPEIIGMFNLFADLISFHMDVVDELDISQSDLKVQRDFNTELEEKIKDRTAELRDKNATLLKANKELQEFSYISSHDLQEPLRKIQIFVSRIQESETGKLSETGQMYFSKIRESAERMQSLIDDLLSYSTIEKSVSKFERADLNMLVGEVLEDLSEEISLKSAAVTMETLPTLTVIPFQMKQLFYNIIGNSVKYASIERPVEIHIGAKLLRDHEGSGRDYCLISVRDNGIGFHPQFSEKIFDLFQRLHGKSEYKGTGIGLAIVKKIVENHNGSVSAVGDLGSGSEIRVLLPQSAM